MEKTLLLQALYQNGSLRVFDVDYDFWDPQDREVAQKYLQRNGLWNEPRDSASMANLVVNFDAKRSCPGSDGTLRTLVSLFRTKCAHQQTTM